MKIPLRAFSVCLAAALLAGVPAARAVAQPAPYTIDAIMELTGSNAFIGSVYSTSLKALEAYVNSHGGINGTPLKINFLDDQTNPQTAVALASQVIAKNPAVFFGGAQTASCAAIAPLAKNGPVDYCISPGYFPEPNGYVFAAAASLRYILNADIRFARGNGWRKVAFINATDATGQSTERALTQLLALPENRDMRIVSAQQFNPTDLSVTAQAQRIKESGADVVFCFAGGTPFGTVLRGLNDVGVALPMVSSSANINAAQLDQYKSFIPPNLYFNGLIYDARDELSRSARVPVDAFLDAFKAAGQTATPGSGIAWDPAWIVVSALRKLGTSATAQQLRDYLLTLHDFNGAMGTYDFRIGDQHGLTESSVVEVRWDPAGHTFAVVSKPGGVPLKPVRR
jgi:branched-chain amino acid transport system substrate-binding protein